MRLFRLTGALLLLGLSACGTTQGDMTLASAPSLLIDQPDGYPYNSRFCP